MAKRREKYHNSTRLWATYASTILSTAFALFLLGLILIGGYVAFRFSNQVKENIGIRVNLAANTSDEQALALCDTIKQSEYVKSIEYISKSHAAQLFMEELGEDFVSFIGDNPLYPTIVVNLKSHTVENNTEYIDFFTEEISKKEYVTDVEYDKVTAGELFSVFYKLAYVGLALTILLLFISITLISNTIRISIYSKRFALKTMLLVGAKKSFVMRPFIIKGISYGFWGGVIASCGLSAILYSVYQQYPTLIDLKVNLNIYIIIGIGLVLLGVLIAFFSTYFSVRKYIRMKDHKLY